MEEAPSHTIQPNSKGITWKKAGQPRPPGSASIFSMAEIFLQEGSGKNSEDVLVIPIIGEKGVMLRHELELVYAKESTTPMWTSLSMTYSKLRGGRILRNTRISKHVDGTGKTYAYALWLWGAEVVNVWMEWHEVQGERVRISTGGRPTETTNHRINSALRAAGYPLFARKMGMNETSRIDIETLPVDQGEIIVAHGVTSGQAVYTLVGTRDLLRIDRDKEGRYEVWQP